MNDRIPGTSYDNPIWYREKWRIYIAECGPYVYQFVHDDFGGDGDQRHGHGHTIVECKAEIDTLEDDE